MFKFILSSIFLVCSTYLWEKGRIRSRIHTSWLVDPDPGGLKTKWKSNFMFDSLSGSGLELYLARTVFSKAWTRNQRQQDAWTRTRWNCIQNTEKITNSPDLNFFLSQQDDFMTMGYLPPRLPVSCLSMAPRFDTKHNASIVARRNPLSELNAQSQAEVRIHNLCFYMFFSVLRIYGMLVWIRIRGSMPLTNGSGSGSVSCCFRH